MSRLRAAIRAARVAAPHPLLPAERLLASERVAAALETRRLVGTGAAQHLAQADPATLGDAALARLLDEAWSGAAGLRVALAATEAALARHRRSLDRAIVHAYLRHYPRASPAFELLRQAARIAAGRHRWPWADRAALWTENAPAAIAARIATAEGRAAFGLAGALAGGGFVRAAALSDPPSAS